MMVHVEEVRLALEPNIENLEERFESLQGYVRGMVGCMYVFVYNVVGEQQFVTNEMKSQWEIH